MEKFMNEIEIIKRPKTPLEKSLNILVNIFCILIVILCSIVCISTLNCRIKNTVTSIAGYSAVTIAPTRSMIASGFNDWDIVLVKKVNTRSLKGDQLNAKGEVVIMGDIIAFYHVEAPNNINYLNYKKYTVDEANQEDPNVTLSIGEFFGSQNELITRAAKREASMIFHHIKEIREDENGKLFFKTYGSSVRNADGSISYDSFWISEDAIVGKYYENASPLLLNTFKTLLTSSGMFMLVSIPLILIILMVFFDIMKSLELSAIENNVLNGKLDLSNPVCVVNHIGFKMSNKTKFKVLAQLSPQERIEAVTYLWQSPKDVEKMKKHYIKQKLLLHFDEERIALKNEYAQILIDNPKSTKHNKEYQKKLEDINKREEDTIKRIKQITKNANLAKQKEIYSQVDQKFNLKNAKVKLKKGESLHIGPHKSVEAKKLVDQIEKGSIAITPDNENLANIDITEAVDTFSTKKNNSKNNKQ